MRSKLALQKQMPTVPRTKVEKSAPKPTQHTYLHESLHVAQRLVPTHARPPDGQHLTQKQLDNNKDRGITTQHTKNTQATNPTLTDLFSSLTQTFARQGEFARQNMNKTTCMGCGRPD